MSTQATTPSQTSPEASFGLGDFLRVISERRALIRNVTLAVVAVTAAVMMSLPTMYSTSAVVMLDQRKNSVADASSVLSQLPTDPSSVQNQIQVLSSRDLALQVIDKLHLEADAEFNPALGGGGISLNPLSYLRAGSSQTGSSRDAIVSNFLSRLSASSIGLSTSIEVSFASRDPSKAALIANTLAETYTEDQVALKVAAARKAAQWLSERMRQLAVQVQQQEAAVQLYKAEHDLVESAQGNSLVDQQLVAINALLVTAQSDLAEKKAAYDRVSALSKTANAGDVTPVVTSKMIGDLRTQEAELVRQEADLATRYGPNHPKMVAIRNEKRDLSNKIAREVAGIAGSMESELEVARAHVGSIEASLARVEKEAREENMARVRLNALQANLASTRTMYESFVQRLRAVQDQDDMQVPEARVISTAPVPSAPSSPHRTLFIGASIPAGILLGILLALLAERFGGSIETRTGPHFGGAFPATGTPPAYAPAAYAPPVAQPAPVLPPILAEFPVASDMRLADWVPDNLASPCGQGLLTLLHSLLPMRAPQARVIVLTSAVPDRRKAVAALALARVAARSGLRTVLIDADQGAIAPAAPGTGIAAVLQGVPLPKVLLRDQLSGAFVLSSKPAVWPAARTVDLIRHLRQSCDLVLIDAAPAGVPGSWPALARLADGVVLFTGADSAQSAFDRVLRLLAAISAPLSGLVVAR